MKRIAIVSIILVLLLATDNNLAAQNKSGYIDIDYLVNLMPGISRIDTLLAVYEQDSLKQKYQALVKEFSDYDSLLMIRGDVINSKASKIKKEDEKYYQTAYILQNWVQYSQEALRAKWQELTQPLQTKVINAFQTVIIEGKYAIRCGDIAFWKSLLAINLYIQVIKKLGLKVPDELLQPMEQVEPPNSAIPVRRTQ